MRLRRGLVPSLAVAVLLLSGCGLGEAGQDAAAPAGQGSASPTAPEGCSYIEAAGGVREVEPPTSVPAVTGQVGATLATSAGELTATLNAERTPCTVGSFVSLAQQGYYNDTTCHRLTTQGIFVLQCGDPSGTGMGGPGYSYADELDGSETYPAGTIAMANAGPNTNGSQFFLVYEDTPLPASYTVFGTLDAASTDVVRAIAAKGTDTGAGDGAPAEPVTISTVTIG